SFSACSVYLCPLSSALCGSLWNSDRQIWENFYEIVIVACQNPIEPRSKRSDQDICNRAFCCSRSTPDRHIAIPGTVGLFRVQPAPRFRPIHTQVEKKLVLRIMIPVEDG